MSGCGRAKFRDWGDDRKLGLEKPNLNEEVSREAVGKNCSTPQGRGNLSLNKSTQPKSGRSVHQQRNGSEEKKIFVNHRYERR